MNNQWIISQLQLIWCKIKNLKPGIQSIVPGTNITVDATDPLNPIVSATGGGSGGDQNNIPVVHTFTLDDIGATGSETQEELEQLIADYINGLNLVIAEDEIHYFQLIGDDSGGGGDFIPLTGTEENKPVTGGVTFGDYEADYSYISSQSISVGFGEQLNTTIQPSQINISNDEGYQSIIFPTKIEFFTSSTITTFGTEGIIYNNLVDNFSTELNFDSPTNNNIQTFQDKSGTIALLSDLQEGYIPITGTEEGKPVTGPIESNYTDSLTPSTTTSSFAGSHIHFYNDDKSTVATLTNEGVSKTDSNTGIFQSIIFQGENGITVTDSNPDEVSGFGVGLVGAEVYDKKENRAAYAQLADVYDANSYSTDEIKTGGTWIDGKPIYRKVKVFSGSELMSNGRLDLLSIFSDVDTICPNSNVFTDWSSDNNVKALGSYMSHFIVSIEKGTLIYQIASMFTDFDTTVFDSITLTLEYTKTTD